MSTPAPRVYVLLLNWNGWRDTIACLGSLFALDYPSVRVVVCDNASTDDSLAQLREWAERQEQRERTIRVAEWRPGNAGGEADAELVLVPTGGNLGFAGGNNVGLRYIMSRADAGYAWVLNNDTIVAADALTHMVQRATSEPGIGAVGATLLEFDEDRVQEAGAVSSRWTGMSRPLHAGDRPEDVRAAVDVDFITGGCMLVPLPTIQRIGLLDERFFMYCEDVDWCMRMHAAGLRLVIAPSALVRHKAGASTSYKSARHDYLVAKSTLLLIRKHHPWRLPVAFAYSLYRMLLPKVVRGQGDRFRAVLRAYGEVWRELRAPRHSSV